jgi:hypothetical protein
VCSSDLNKVTTMRKLNDYLAFIVLIILAVGMVSAVPQAGKISVPIMKPTINPKIFAVFIHQNYMKIAPAAAGNTQPLSVNVNVTSAVTKRDICGLNATNFKIDGPAYISNVLATSGVAVNQPMTCDYMLYVTPTSPWISGTNAFVLNYVQSGQKLANTTLVFRI